MLRGKMAQKRQSKLFFRRYACFDDFRRGIGLGNRGFGRSGAFLCIFGGFCGVLGYMAVLHKIVFRIFWQVLKWGSAVTERVILPWRRLGQRIRKKIKKNLKNFRKTSGNSTENDI